jgi:hypothetical protein
MEEYFPSIKMEEVGDRFEGIVTQRRIITKGEEKALVIDITLDEPRVQGDTTSMNWSWWLHPSQALAMLQKVLKDADAPQGSPFPGDWVSCELVGFQPTARTPKKIYDVKWKDRADEVESWD